jgi:hypothetical protein
MVKILSAFKKRDKDYKIVYSGRILKGIVEEYSKKKED